MLQRTTISRTSCLRRPLCSNLLRLSCLLLGPNLAMSTHTRPIQSQDGQVSSEGASGAIPASDSLAAASRQAEILWEIVKKRELNSMLQLVPDDVVDALLQQHKMSGKSEINTFSASDAALLRKLPISSFHLDSFAERHILFRSPAEVTPLSVLQVSASKVVFRYAISSPSGEQCVLSVVMTLQEGLESQYKSSPILVPTWRLASITGESASTDEPVTSPAPCLSPEAAVQAQLQALKSDDLATVFAFASPGNQAVTGPLRRFTAMLASPTYRPLVGYSTSEQQHAYMRSADSYTTVVAIKSSNTGLGRAVQLLYGWELSLCEDMTWRTNSVQLLSGSTI